MSNVEMLLVDALETAVEELSIGLEAKGFDFDVEDSPNTNQYMLIPTDDSQVIYVTAELSWMMSPQFSWTSMTWMRTGRNSGITGTWRLRRPSLTSPRSDGECTISAQI